MWLFVHRPFEVWPFLGDFRIELLYMLATGAIWISSAQKHSIANPLHFAFAGFSAALIFCFMLSPWGDACWPTVDIYWKFLVFYLLIVTVIHDEEGLRKIILAFMAVFFLYMLHSLWEYKNGRHVARMGVVRMVGVDSSFGDPNAFGGSVVLALVFVPALWAAFPTQRIRAFLVAFVGLAMTCIALTGSRGAFVGLVAAGAVIIARSRRRWEMAVYAVMLAPLLFVLLPEKHQKRFETILNPEAGPRNAQLSADARIDGLYTGLRLFQENPLNGIGPGAWRPATGRKLESHNLYGQLLGEMGIVGAMAFLGLLSAFVVNHVRIRRAYRDHPEWGRDFLYQIDGAVMLAVVLMLLHGNFGHNLFRYQWVWYGAFLVIVQHCVRQRLVEEGDWEVMQNSGAMASVRLGQPAAL